MTIAKVLASGYLSLGAVMISKHIAIAIIEEGGEFFHGMTYSGHLLPGQLQKKILEFFAMKR